MKPDDGGSPILGYTVSASPGGLSCSTDSADDLSCTITGLTNGVTYTFTVTARNAAGSSAPPPPNSGTGNGTPTGTGTPGTPPDPVGGVTPVPDPDDGTQVTLHWLAAASDLPIIGYTATAQPGGQSCTTGGALFCTITGLDPNTDYTFTVVAINGAGSSDPSPPVALPPGITTISPAHGRVAGGTTITITGTHLSGATAVTFGNNSAASFTVVDDTSLTVVSLPGQVGTVDIHVTTPAGSSPPTTGDQFTYDPAPDTTPPQVTYARTPPPNANGWNNSPVTVTFTCTDDGTGVASCPGPVTLSADGANQSVTRTAVDNAGNTTSTNVTGINIDTLAPTVTITGIIDGATYLEGTLPVAGCTTTDATSGVATQATPTTSNDGNAHYTVTCAGGTDIAGNAAAPMTATYTTVPAVRAVGSSTRTSTGNNSLSATITSPVPAGDTLAVSVATGTFAGAVGCTDTQGNTYTVAADRNTGNGRVFVCTSHLTHALTSPDTITATYPGFGGLSLISLDDISALATTGTVDTTTSANGNSANASSGPVTTTHTGEVLFGVIAHNSTPTITGGTGYTIVGQVIGGTGSGQRTLTPEYRLASTPGSYAATATISNGGQFWQAGIIAYQ